MAASAKESVQWFFETPDKGEISASTGVKMSPSHWTDNRALEEEYQTKVRDGTLGASCMLEMGAKKFIYEVDFVKMTQVNPKTGAVRKLRRGPEPEPSVSSSSSGGKVRWEFEDEGDKWVSVLVEDFATLEGAYVAYAAAHKASPGADSRYILALGPEKWTYLVNLDTGSVGFMTQQNLKRRKAGGSSGQAGKLRKLRRLPQGAPQVVCGQPSMQVRWEVDFQEEGKGWLQCSVDDQIKLEESYCTNPLGKFDIPLGPKQWVYKVDFKAMEQLNPKSKATRKFQRRMVLVAAFAHWEVQYESGWGAVSLVDSAALERAYCVNPKGDHCLRLGPQQWEYDVHLGREPITQVNPKTSKQRHLRRKTLGKDENLPAQHFPIAKEGAMGAAAAAMVLGVDVGGDAPQPAAGYGSPSGAAAAKGAGRGQLGNMAGVGGAAASGRMPVAEMMQGFEPTKSLEDYLREDVSKVVGPAAQFLDVLINFSTNKMNELSSVSPTAEKKVEYKLTDDEVIALVLYTSDLRIIAPQPPGPFDKSESQFYWQLRRCFVERKLEEMQHLFGYLYFLFSGLRKLPDGPSEAPIYRGLTEEARQSIAQEYRFRRMVRYSALTSWSKSRRTAVSFAQANGVILEIHTQNTDLCGFSALPEEEEVVLHPEVKLIVHTERMEDDGDGRLVVKMLAESNQVEFVY